MGEILHARPDVYIYEDTIDYYRRESDNPLNYTVCAFSDQKKPLGIATMKILNEFSAELVVIAVLRDFERNGIGSSLLAAVETEARRRNKIFFTLKAFGPSDLDKQSQIALNFFRGHEICILGEYDFIWQGCYCALLAKRL
ncbi:MAG: GNAT family N-acetyltransferase [Cyanobacteria bacterium REEB67]|nr:GNAT family N-acetyltransferase [Cyanobacteria bacterium REEB67]